MTPNHPISSQAADGGFNENLDMSERSKNEFVCLALAARWVCPQNVATIETFEDQKQLVVEAV